MEQPAPKDPLDEHWLLKALDAEIVGQSASLAATGRTRWALILALGALIAAAFQAWPSVCLHAKAFALAIAISLSWDVVLKFKSGIDRPLAAPSRRMGGFIDLSQIIGAARSAILLETIQQLVIIWICLSVTVPHFGWIAVAASINVVSGIVALIASMRTFAPVELPIEPEPRKWLQGVAFNWALHTAPAILAIWPFLNSSVEVNIADAKLAAILAAIPYVLTLLANDDLQIRFTDAHRSIRQQLAFNRISPDQALLELQLLSLGAERAQALARPFNEIMTAVERVRITLTLARSQIAEDFSKELVSTTIQKGRHEYNQLAKKVNRLKTQQKILGYFAPKNVEQISTLMTPIAAATTPLCNEIKKLSADYGVTKPEII